MARKTLSLGTDIAQYKITEEMSQDKLGVSYLGEADAGAVIIREYFPANLSRRRGNKLHASRKSLQTEFGQAVANEADKFKRYAGLETEGLLGGLEVVEDNGTVYLITEAPAGESLEAIQARDGVLSPGFSRTLFETLLPGLQSLEDAGLVHALIAPDRIIRQDDGQSIIIAPNHLQDFRTESSVLKTAPEDTPYLAPEMLNSRAGDIGPWSDVYSLCASFYFLLTGRAPTSAKSRIIALEAGHEDLLDLAGLERQLADDPTLYAALETGLKPLVEERLASVAEFAAAITLAPVAPPVEDEEAVGFPMVSPPGWWARNGRSVIAAAAVLCLLLVAVPLALLMDGSETEADDGRVDIAEVETPIPEPTPQPTESEAVVGTEADTENEDEAPLPAVEAADEDAPVSNSVAAWLAVDQNDPDAVLDFMRNADPEPDVRRQARARWQTLEEEGWLAAQDVGSVEAVSAFMAIYGERPPGIAVYYEEASDLLAALEAPVEPEFIETEPAADDVEDEPTEEAPPAVFQDCDECPVLTMASLAGEEIAVAVRETTIGEFGAYQTAVGISASAGCFVHQTGSSSLWSYGSSASFRAPGYPVSASHPAVCVSYAEAEGYAKWLSDQTGKTYRLPSEAEWRLLAGPMPSASDSCSAGNFADSRLSAIGVQLPAASCSDGEAFAIAASADSEAVRNLYGNVEEWVSDCENGDCSRRMAIGGSWASVSGQFRNGLRGIYSPSSRSSTLGFRLVREDYTN